MIKSIDFPEELIIEIDRFRGTNYFRQFSPAIIYLVHLGLQYHEKMQQDNRPMIFQPAQEYNPFFPATWTVSTGTDYQWYTGNINYGTAADTGNIYYG